MAQNHKDQNAFWEAMKEKYVRRNECLKQQEICLRERLEQLKQLMERQQNGDECDCIPEKLEKPSLVQCLMEKGKSLILGNCKCGDPKIGEDLLCACHISNSKISLNVNTTCPMQEHPPPDGCLNTTCDFYDPKLASIQTDPSTFSLRTTDIYYMDKLADLVNEEKYMQENIETLESREHSYLKAIQELNSAIKNRTKDDPMRREFKNMTEALEEENRKLKNELEDLRLELKHCFERVEGPLKRSLEDQRENCSRMEREMKNLQTSMANREDGYLKEINEIKAKLCKACCTMVDLNSVNSKLKEDLIILRTTCGNLEEELLKQQMKEAENILKFKNALSRRPQIENQNRGDDAPNQELTQIAKKLSETLKEVSPCITNVPSGLQETVKNIKQLTELVGERSEQQKKHRKGKFDKNVSCGCPLETEIVKPEQPPSVRCSCSNSSLRIKPQMISSGLQNGPSGLTRTKGNCSCSVSLVGLPVKETMTKIDHNVAEVDHNVAKGDENVAAVDQNDSSECQVCFGQDDCDPSKPQIQEPHQPSIETVCSCPSENAKIVGPSEEFVAVKNLNALSMPPGELIIQSIKTLGALSSSPAKRKDKGKKFKVDTTCDILDFPPEDIHVVTTIAKTGSIEITTEGPPGVIETKVNYLPDGKIEVLTKLIDHNKMNTFLDGTLLHVPEGPPEVECFESKTCSGHCIRDLDCHSSEMRIVDYSDPGKNCGTQNNTETMETTPYPQLMVNNNFVLFSGKATNPFNPWLWKNEKFNSNPVECPEISEEDIEVFSLKNGKMRAKGKLNDLEDDYPKTLILSSRPSLTDVEKYSQGENALSFRLSSVSFIHPDILETISEGDEDADSTRTDFGQDSDKIFREDIASKEIDENPQEFEAKALSEDKNEKNIQKIQYRVYEKTLRDDILTSTNDPSDKKNIHKLLCFNNDVDELELDRIGNDNLSSVTQDLKENIPSDDFSTLHLNSLRKPLNTKISKVEIDADDKSWKELKIDCFDSEISVFNATAYNVDSNILTEERCSQNTWNILRNEGNTNLLRNSLELKESKSMFEKKSDHSKCLRVCKSAVLSLGSLKIDLEMIKLSYLGPRVGDSDEDQFSISRRLKKGPLTGVSEKYILPPASVMGFSSNVEKEGSNASDDPRIVPYQNYQCYVCNCSGANENKDTPKDEAKPNENLEERIDRLLETNPLAPSHGRNCQCVDCIIHAAKKTKSSKNCKCSKKREDLAKKIEPASHRCKCKTRKEKRETTNDSDLKIMSSLRNAGDITKHDEDCTCVDCICNPCNFKKNSKSAVDCDCKNCECDTCCDVAKNSLAKLTWFEMKKPEEITVMSLRIPCDCGVKCPCSPCMDNSKKPPAPIQESQGHSQNMKNPDIPCKKCQIRVPGPQSEQPKLSPQQSNKTERRDIGCGPSENTPATAPMRNPDTWKNVVGCPCSPATDKKEVCDCKVCECKPCGYPDKARKPCDCKPPQKDPRDEAHKGNHCKCDLCVCTRCPKATKNIAVGENSDNLEPQVTALVQESNISCDCKPCECLFCFDAKFRRNIESIKLNNNVGEESIEKDICECFRCGCDPCKSSGRPEKEFQKNNEEILIESKDIQGEVEKPQKIFDESLNCNCETCNCENCKKKGNVAPSQQQTPIQKPNTETEKVGDALYTSCDCKECKCNPCSAEHNDLIEKALGEMLNESNNLKPNFEKFTACDCAECKCESCKGRNAENKNEERISNQLTQLQESIQKESIDLNEGASDRYVATNPVANNEICCACIKFTNGLNDPSVKCDQHCLVCRKNGDFPQVTKESHVVQKIPCDCKLCSCNPCPDDRISKIGDADRAKDEIQQVLNKIGLACDQAEVKLQPLMKQASSFESTISKMKLKLNNLQQKCRDKDQIINAMTNELKLRSDSGVFSNLLKEMAHPKNQYVPDFNRTYVCDYLPKPKHITAHKLPHRKSSLQQFGSLEPILELDRYLPSTNENMCLCQKNLDISGLEITDIRRVTIDSILIKWHSPNNINNITGYQIFVNEELRYKVLSPNRTNAVIDSLDLCNSLEIMLFAMTLSGRCEPPALATYKI